LLVKFLFSEDKLSVQVHPDDKFAGEHEKSPGGRGKTEMWYVVRAHPGAQVRVGLKPDITCKELQASISSGAAEDCLTQIPLHAGDAVFVPAGTVHTIGPGLLLCEIQQHSDLTYRVYDYNRPDAQGKLRPLHIDKALQVIRFGEQPGGKIDPVQVTRGVAKETYLAACPYFATEKWESGEEIDASTTAAHFDLLIFLEGHGKLCCGRDSIPFSPTQVWMLPAALGGYRIEPDSQTSLLRTYVPTDRYEFSGKLASRGVAEATIAQLIHG